MNKVSRDFFFFRRWIMFFLAAQFFIKQARHVFLSISWNLKKSWSHEKEESFIINKQKERVNKCGWFFWHFVNVSRELEIYKTKTLRRHFLSFAKNNKHFVTGYYCNNNKLIWTAFNKALLIWWKKNFMFTNEN